MQLITNFDNTHDIAIFGSKFKFHSKLIMTFLFSLSMSFHKFVKRNSLDGPTVQRMDFDTISSGFGYDSLTRMWFTLRTKIIIETLICIHDNRWGDGFFGYGSFGHQSASSASLNGICFFEQRRKTFFFVKDTHQYPF